MTTDIAEFLLARITEDEAEPTLCREGWVDLADMLPMGSWDWKRVLAECEAKRRIVEWHHADEGACQDDGYPMPCPTLRFLALPYAEHPDYQSALRP